MVKVKFTLYNRSTKSIIKGTKTIKGKSFHHISDDATKIITKYIPAFIKKQGLEECPDQWEISGFVAFDEWESRNIRAKEAMV